MRFEIGSEDIICSWFVIKKKMPKEIKIRIAELLSEGVRDGYFHYSFNGITDDVGWWSVYPVLTD